MKKTWSAYLGSFAAIVLSLAVIFPLIFGILGAFKPADEFLVPPSHNSVADSTAVPGEEKHFSFPRIWPQNPTLENFSLARKQIQVERMLLNSLIVSTLGTVVRMIFALLAAYAFAFFEFKGKKVLFFLLLGPMMLPGDILITTNYQTVSQLNLTDTYLGMAVTSFVGASQMFMLRQQFRYSPQALRESALLDGCGDIRFIVSILLPLCRPIFVTLSVQAFITIWNMYLWPLMVTDTDAMRTIQIGIKELTSYDNDISHHTTLAGVAISLIPAFILFFCLRRAINRSMEEGALIG